MIKNMVSATTKCYPRERHGVSAPASPGADTERFLALLRVKMPLQAQCLESVKDVEAGMIVRHKTGLPELSQKAAGMMGKICPKSGGILRGTQCIICSVCFALCCVCSVYCMCGNGCTSEEGTGKKGAGIFLVHPYSNYVRADL